MLIRHISAGEISRNGRVRRAKLPRPCATNLRVPISGPVQPSVKQFATITVIGRDKTGVIARVTNFLFEQNANIEALEEQVTRGQFSMTLQASWAKSKFDAAQIRAGLAGLAAALGMEIKVRFTDPKHRQRFA